MSETTLLILAALVAVLLIVWILRSRKNPNHHIDTSVTAVGAVTEAVRDLADDVSKAVTHTAKADVEPSSAKADASAVAPSEAAAIMASADAAADIPPAIPTGSSADNLRLLKGVGPKLAALLTQLGITRFDQIAAWNEADIVRVDAQLGNFKGRIVRDNWIEQARLLASGDVAGFEAKFGKLDGPSNN